MQRARPLLALPWKKRVDGIPKHVRCALQAQQGVIPKPVWLEAVAAYPPDPIFLDEKTPENTLEFPTNELFERLVKRRMPFFQYEYYEDMGTFKSLGQRLVERQWKLMKAGLSEKHALQAAEREFSKEIDALLQQVRREYTETQEVPVSSIMEAKDSRVRKHLELRAALRRGGNEPKQQTTLSVLEERMHQMHKQPPDKVVKLFSAEVPKIGKFRKKLLADLAYEKRYSKIFYNPYFLRPRTTDPLAKEITDWINRMRFNPPSEEDRLRVRAFGQEVAKKGNFVRSAYAEYGARLADYLAFWELEKEWRLKSNEDSETAEKFSPQITEMPLVRNMDRQYTEEMCFAQTQLAEKFAAIYHIPGPDFDKPEHERLRIPGLHDLVPDMNPEKWLQVDDYPFKNDDERHCFREIQKLLNAAEGKGLEPLEAVFKEVRDLQKGNLLKTLKAMKANRDRAGDGGHGPGGPSADDEPTSSAWDDNIEEWENKGETQEAYDIT
eukprot:gb/GEZN01006504.1/.p1 GENE.gb/GEZN01006504.1/~~gb/GEZN01006504.1/.p1  ORF type:complete len:495 (+),score=79.41 gb/GEZN01006504.1/:31-1515(+)